MRLAALAVLLPIASALPAGAAEPPKLRAVVYEITDILGALGAYEEPAPADPQQPNLDPGPVLTPAQAEALERLYEECERRRERALGLVLASLYLEEPLLRLRMLLSEEPVLKEFQGCLIIRHSEAGHARIRAHLELIRALSGLPPGRIWIDGEDED